MTYKFSLPVLLLFSMAVVTGCNSGSYTSPTGQLRANAEDTADTALNSDGEYGSGDTEYSVVGGAGDSVVSVRSSSAITESQAQYRLTFAANWSSATYPHYFPSDPNFSDVASAAPQGSLSSWRPSQFARAGVRQVDELGRRDTIIASIRQSIAAGSARQLSEGSVFPILSR